MARSTLLCALTVFGIFPGESVAPVDSALLRRIRYRLIGPSRGRRVTTVTRTLGPVAP